MPLGVGAGMPSEGDGDGVATALEDGGLTVVTGAVPVVTGADVVAAGSFGGFCIGVVAGFCVVVVGGASSDVGAAVDLGVGVSVVGTGVLATVVGTVDGPAGDLAVVNGAAEVGSCAAGVCGADAMTVCDGGADGVTVCGGGGGGGADGTSATGAGVGAGAGGGGGGGGGGGAGGGSAIFTGGGASCAGIGGLTGVVGGAGATGTTGAAKDGVIPPVSAVNETAVPEANTTKIPRPQVRNSAPIVHRLLFTPEPDHAAPPLAGCIRLVIGRRVAGVTRDRPALAASALKATTESMYLAGDLLEECCELEVGSPRRHTRSR